MSRPIKTLLVTSSILFVIICIGQCIALSLEPSLALHHGKYVAFLAFGGIFGGAGAAAIMRFVDRSGAKETSQLKSRIDELERSIEDLKDVTDRREEFIASFAHELKTPLTAIIGYADMLRSKDMAPKTRFTAAGYIFSEGKRLEALSLKLMDIIVAGKNETELRAFEIGYFIRSIAAVTVPSLSSDDITLDMRWEQGEIYIEPDLFKTLMINLVDNARKASHKKSIIEIYGKVEDGGYALYVKDYGRGIAKEELSKITEPFYMIDKSRSRAQNGAGLGLALCQRIAELHDTALEYESEPGKGTTVRILLKGGGKA